MLECQGRCFAVGSTTQDPSEDRPNNLDALRTVGAIQSEDTCVENCMIGSRWYLKKRGTRVYLAADSINEY